MTKDLLDLLLQNYRSAQNILSTDSLIHVQGNGGNLSFKSNKYLAIKSSGFNLADRNVDCLSVIDTHVFCQHERSSSSYLISGKKESMETPFHVFLKSKYVLHLHHLPCLAISILGKSNELIEILKISGKFPQDPILIDYAHPGTPLFSSIAQHSNTSKFFILESHGVILCADTVSELSSSLTLLDSLSEELLSSITKDYNSYIRRLLSSVDKDIFLSALKDCLNRTIYFPDQAVFCRDDLKLRQVLDIINTTSWDSIIESNILIEKFSTPFVDMIRTIGYLQSCAYHSDYQPKTLSDIQVAKLGIDPLENYRLKLVPNIN